MRALAVLLSRQATPTPADDGNDGASGLMWNGASFAWDQILQLLQWLGAFAANLVWAGLIIIAIFWITGRLRRRIRTMLEARVKGRSNLPALVDNILQIGVYVIAALFAFSALGADSSAFVQAFGLITAAVSLSLQDVLKNFVAGLYMLSEEPFKAGDRLEVSGQVGTVEEINIRTTVLRNDKAEQVMVPNYEVFSKIVTNRTAYRLQTLTVQVTGIKDEFIDVLDSQDTWFGDVQELLETPPQIQLSKLAPDDCELTITFWFTPGKDLRREVVKRLHARFPDATLTIST